MVGFRDLVGTGIAPVLKKTAVKKPLIHFKSKFQRFQACVVEGICVLIYHGFVLGRIS